MSNNYWNASRVLKRQQFSPQCLTSGCCESTMDTKNGVKVFNTLNLGYSGFSSFESPNSVEVTKAKPLPEEYDFYPLTLDEAKFIGEDTCAGPYGGITLAYSHLFKGKKYLTPCVEVCHYPKDPTKRHSRASYGDSLYETPEEAAAEAARFAEYVTKVGKRYNIFGYFENDDQGDRFSSFIMIPVAKALSFKNYGEYVKFIVNLVKDYKEEPANASVPNPKVDVVYGRALVLSPGGEPQNLAHIEKSKAISTPNCPPLYACSFYYMRNVIRKLWGDRVNNRPTMYLTVRIYSPGNEGRTLNGWKVESIGHTDEAKDEEVTFQQGGKTYTCKIAHVKELYLGF